MSSNLFAYKYSIEEWYKTDNLNESDVAVIVDTSREIIWFYSGNKSTARNRSKARALLNDLMKNYPSYTLKNVAEDTPDDIIILIEDLKNQFFKRKISSLTYDLRKISNFFFYTSSVASLCLIITISFSLLTLFNSDTIVFEGYLHFSISRSNFSFQINLISSLFLGSFICFILTFLIAFFLMKKKLILYSLIALIVSFSAFFILLVWDFLVFFKISGYTIYFRVDVFNMYTFNLNIIAVVDLVIGIYLIIKGPKILSNFP